MCFKVGDKVVVIANNAGHYRDIGSVCYLLKHRSRRWETSSELFGEYDDGCTLMLEDFELIEEETDMNTFSKKDLKTGMVVVHGNGKTGMVLLSTDSGDIVSGDTWYALSNVDEDLTKRCGKEYHIVEVWQPKYNNDYLGHWAKPNLPYGCKKIWERRPELTPEQIKQQELQAKYDAAKKELEELGRALGTVK